MLDAARQHGWKPGEWAQTLLRCGPARVRELVQTGALDGLVVGGQLYVDPETAIARAAEEADATLNIATEQREAATQALRDYLRHHPATGNWALGRETGRPIVSARRGSNWQHFGLEYHTVGIDPKAAYAWVVANDGDLAVRLPGVRGFTDLLGRLDGVSALSWITALGTPGQPHRLGGWVRVDPQVWPVTVDPDTEELISEPTGADYADGVASLESQ